jgi:excisionase family DNA binding protein
VTGPLLLTVREAVPITGIGRDTLCRLVAEGRIRTVAVGRKRLIPRRELDAWIERELHRETAGGAA